MNRQFFAFVVFFSLCLGCGGGDNGGAPTNPGNTELPRITQSDITATSYQDGTPGMTILWKTDVRSIGRVFYGTTDPPTEVVEETGALKTSHYIEIRWLEPETVYYFQVESSAGGYSTATREPTPCGTVRTGIFLDGTPPSAALIEPRAGSFLSGMITLKVYAVDPEGMGHVLFFIDGGRLGDLTAPEADGFYYVRNIDTTTYPDGNHTLSTIVENSSGLTTGDWSVVTFDNVDPSVLWVFPQTGATLQPDGGGRINLKVRSWDSDYGYHGSPKDVLFFLNGEATTMSFGLTNDYGYFSLVWNCSSLPAGVHVLGAQAIDNAGNLSDLETVTIIKS